MLVRLYLQGRQDQRDLRVRPFEKEVFHPATLASHLEHVSPELVRIERNASRIYYQLTRRGEAAAASILARRDPSKFILGSRTDLEHLTWMLDRKREIDPWTIMGYWKPDPRLRTSPKIIRSEISFTQTPDNNQINTTAELRSIAENLPNLTWTSVDDSAALSGPHVDLKERQGWRAFELEASGFKEKRVVLPDWF